MNKNVHVSPGAVQSVSMDTTIGVSFLDPLNDYELINRIGTGTYGDVFKVSGENVRSAWRLAHVRVLINSIWVRWV